MADFDRGKITQLLERFHQGEDTALDAVFPLVYEQLVGIAHRERQRHCDMAQLSTHSLVHEAYLNLREQKRTQWKSRGHFFAVAAIVMRRVLVDRARASLRHKRGAGAVHLSLDDVNGLFDESRDEEILEIDALLTQLAESSERAARVVECRFFAGLSIEETAEAIGASPMTVKREWQLARAWLIREFSADAGRT